MRNGLTKREILLLVNEYIGVSEGYLGDFSYRSHAEFYPLYCDLDIDPYEMEGTTRMKFIKILSEQQPINQAKIVRGSLLRFPVNQDKKPITRTEQLYQKFDDIAGRLEKSSGISNPMIESRYETVIKALNDADILMKESNAASSVDRVITSLQGYLEEICIESGITISENEKITSLYKVIKSTHPAFKINGTRNQDITKIMQSLSAIIDAFQPIRNQASLAHPNKDLLDNPEANLIINTAKTIFNYLNDKINA